MLASSSSHHIHSSELMGYSENFLQSNISHPLGLQQHFGNFDPMVVLEQLFVPSMEPSADKRDTVVSAPVASAFSQHLVPHTAIEPLHMKSKLLSSPAPTAANANTSTSLPFYQGAITSSANLSIPIYNGLDTSILHHSSCDFLGLLSPAVLSTNWNHILGTPNADSHRNPTVGTMHAKTTAGFCGATSLSSHVVAIPEGTLTSFGSLPLAYPHSSMSWDHAIVPAECVPAHHANNQPFSIFQAAQVPTQDLHTNAIEKHTQQATVSDLSPLSVLPEPLFSTHSDPVPVIQPHIPSCSNQVQYDLLNRPYSSSSSIANTIQLGSKSSESGGEIEESESGLSSDASTSPKNRHKVEGSWKNQPRNSISKKQKKVFYGWLLDNINFPFPTENERLSSLAVDLISEKQFRYWFANIRCRQFTKHRDSKGSQFFTPNAKFYETCTRIGLPIKQGMPASVRRNAKLQRRPLKEKN